VWGAYTSRYPRSGVDRVFLSVDSNLDDINQDWVKKIGRCVRSESELDLWQRKVRIQWRG
jgi:hypothetical protein